MNDTIVAQATPSGFGGVAIIRISGSRVKDICLELWGRLPAERTAVLKTIKDVNEELIDYGVVLLFYGPNSFTGEDVLEFHGHGGPLVVSLVIKRLMSFGLRMAHPGEFSERAFLNNKLDLAQAEGIADLINAQTEQAAKCAVKSLNGDFSAKINAIAEEMVRVRVLVEAQIDFPDEEIDVLSDQNLKLLIFNLITSVSDILRVAKRGRLLQAGMTIALVGRPNVGKSSLFNKIIGINRAIVTPYAGTTRDVLQETIQVDGVPLHIIDTAGIRKDAELIEQEGILRALEQCSLVDWILLVVDAREPNLSPEELQIINDYPNKTFIIKNKVDLLERDIKIIDSQQKLISAKTGVGFDELYALFQTLIGFESGQESLFTARQRHIDNLVSSLRYCEQALQEVEKRPECVAQELRLAHDELGEITGKISADDLLGKIFSSFCIGK